MVELLLGSVTWFPQEYAHDFYATKGSLALVATLMVVVHMVRTWPTVVRTGQRLRYLSLLYFCALVTFASVEQVHEAETVDYRNLGGMLGCVLVIVAMAVSLREDRRR